MRKIVVTEFLSLDGIMEDPAWSAPYWNDEIAQFKSEEMVATDALLLGRVTYQGFAAAWPESKDDGADNMNNMPKYVVSTTLDKAEWNNSRLIKSNVVDEISKLKQQDGQNILVYGSAALVQSLIKANLIDEYRFLVYPVTIGGGKRIFQDGAKIDLTLVEAKSLSSGVVALVYQPAKAD